jgi:replicative DNA helicase
MSRTNELAFYATDATKREVDRRAEAEDLSRSDYLNQLVVRHLQQDDADDFADEVHAEDRIRELIQIATDEMQQATAEMRDLNAKTGAYAAANFELLKTDYEDAARRDALSTGSRRMRQDLDVVAGELDSDTHAGDTPPESTPNEVVSDSGSDDGGERKGPFERMRDNEGD